MGLITNFQKNKAIKSYINKLGKDLAKRYGKSKTYTPEQVVRTVQDEDYNWRHICYAHAMYTSCEKFNKWHEEQGDTCDFYAMREEITENFYNGDTDSFEAASLSNSDMDSVDTGGIGGDD